MMSRTKASFAPSLPPGCRSRNSRAVKPLASNSAIASASPSASCIVVEVVGARPFGQASCATGRQRRMSALPAERAVALRGHGDQRNLEPLGVGDDRRQFDALAGPGQRQHDVAVLHHAEVAVACLGRMHEGGGLPGRGECGGDLARDMAGLADAGDDGAARRGEQRVDAPPERGAQRIPARRRERLLQGEEALALDGDRAPRRGNRLGRVANSSRRSITGAGGMAN